MKYKPNHIINKTRYLLDNSKSIFKKNYGAWLIMLPSIILFAFFVWGPLFSNISLSFYETIGFEKVEFVGFKKYVEVFKDPIFFKALWNTVQYAFWSIVIGFGIPIFASVLISEVVHLKGFFKTSLYFPSVIPGIASVIMWTFFMDPDPSGVFNSLLARIGIDPLPWLNSQTGVIPLIIFTMTWKGFGATMLIYLATLQTIDPLYYEVARLEGAGVWSRFRYVTFPYLWSNIKILFILQIITVFQVFYEPLVLTSGGPNYASISLNQLLYNYVFTGEVNASKAAALGVIISIILFLLTFIYFKSNKKEEE